MEDASTQLQRGMNLLEQHQFPAAISVFNGILKEQPDQLQALFGKALAQAHSGELGEAAKNFEHLLDLSPQLESARQILAQIQKAVPDVTVTQLKMGQLITALRRVMQRFSNDPILCMEVGTIRSYDEKHESTRHIGETLGSRGTLQSVDTEAESIRIARDICSHLNNVTWHHTDGLSYLRSALAAGQYFHFILLDGMNDSLLTLREFGVAMQLVSEGGIIVIDDAGVALDGSTPDPTQPLAQKGVKVYQFLRARGVPVSILQSAVGTQLVIERTWRDCAALHGSLTAVLEEAERSAGAAV